MTFSKSKSNMDSSRGSSFVELVFISSLVSRLFVISFASLLLLSSLPLLWWSSTSSSPQCPNSSEFSKESNIEPSHGISWLVGVVLSAFLFGLTMLVRRLVPVLPETTSSLSLPAGRFSSSQSDIVSLRANKRIKSIWREERSLPQLGSHLDLASQNVLAALVSVLFHGLG